MSLYSKPFIARYNQNMLSSVQKSLQTMSIVLASSSKPRIEMFERMGIPVTVKSSNFEENLDRTAFSPYDYVMLTAQGKALDVLEHTPLADMIIGADTMIIAPPEDGQVTAANSMIGKPLDVADAQTILSRLSGRTHHVVTGVCLLVRVSLSADAAQRQFSPLSALTGTDGAVFVDVLAAGESSVVKVNFYSKTTVHFDELDQATIDAYIASGEPWNKAGAYGIQGVGGSFIRAIEGCFWNCVGFPMNAFSRLFKRIVELMP